MRLAIALLLSVSTGLTAVQAPARADITFAVVGGMSGPFEKIGSWFRNGARGAVEAINQDGGLVGETVTFIVRDDECNPDKAVAIAKEIVDMDIPFVMGHLCSDASIAAADLYEKNGVIAVSPASTNPKLTDRGMTNIFRTTGRDDMQGFVLADHILRNHRTKKLAILYDDTAYSRGVASVAKDFLNRSKFEEVMYVAAPGDPYDFTSLLEQIKKERVRTVLYPALPAPLAAFLRQAKEKKVRFRLIGGDTLTNVLLEGDEIRLLDGVQFSFPPDPSDDKRNAEIVERYKSEGFNPEAFTFYSYAAVQVWAQAVKAAGSTDAAMVAKALRSQTFDTVLGDITFDKKGDVSNPGFVIFYYNKGQKHYLE